MTIYQMMYFSRFAHNVKIHPSIILADFWGLGKLVTLQFNYCPQTSSIQTIYSKKLKFFEKNPYIVNVLL